MTDHNDIQATLVDAYLDMLLHDIDAPPPLGLDMLTADLLRDLVRSQHIPIDDMLMRRVWLRALADAQLKRQVSPSQNGNQSQSKRQESLMQTITSPKLSSMKPQQAARIRLPLTLVITSVFTLMFAGILFMLNAGPFNTNTGMIQQQIETENVDIEDLLERYINELIVAGNTSDVDTILSPEHKLDINLRADTEFGDQALNTLVSLSDLIESISIQDVVSDSDSVWARVELELNFISERETSIAEPKERVTTSGIIIAYLDNDTDKFNASYIMFNIDIPSMADMEQVDRNTQLARRVLDTFWGEEAAALDVNWARLADSYAADYQLHIDSGDTFMTFATTEDLPVARVLESIRTDIVFTHPNISTDVMEVHASGNFVTVDAILNIQSPNGERSTIFSIVYRIENDVIAEEWWTTESETFGFESN